VVVAYRPYWVEEFARIAGRIRDLVGPAAIRIDHIGSTAVPGLGAKDVIDLQITVGDLDQVAAVEAARIFPDSIDGYLLIKDPVFHILYAAASLWAEKVGWRPGDDYR